MDLRDLSWLETLAEHRHVTDSAAALGVPQPTLTRALQRVERECGTRIFHRVPDGLRITPTGEIVVAAARDLVARHRQLVADLDTVLDPDTGVVRLAFLDSMATSMVPRLLGGFHSHAPGIRVLLRQEPAHEMLTDLEAGAVDLAITSPSPLLGDGWLPLQEERLVVVVPPGHRWRTRKRLRLAELTGEELVTTPTGFGFRALVDDLLATAGARPTVAFESQELGTIAGLVAAGLGIAIVPEPNARHSGAVPIPIAEAAARRTVGLGWRADRELTPPAQRFRDFVVEHGA